MSLSQMENLFVEDNVTRDNDFVGGKFKTPITAMIRGVPKKNARCRAGFQFVMNM